ncbi:hypothetical protein FGADI_12059 [Fusarium gaditjirri]|uniref:Uncharacterized protein n=1 Tax=Fusarium gaditjirri TaxID=282569 RepID=A0A8H4WPQ4_9HYPO|nr:hypothetical protein FGADI_12059 [Fusarium gaditjirri]
MFGAFALVWLSLLGTCLAQNSSLPEDCPKEIIDADEGLTFNASGTLPVKFKGQIYTWYISTAVTDERDQNHTFNNGHSLQWLQAFISVPRQFVGSRDGKNSQVCPYMFKGLNKTSESPDDADESCKGVMSDECIDEFENLTLPLGTGKNCPSYQDFDLSQECMKHLDSAMLFYFHSVPPRNFSTARCSLDKMPYLDIPDNHKTYGTYISPGLEGDIDYDDFDMYDLRVQQTIPMFMMVLSSGVKDSKMVCIAPNKVVQGSRKPKSKLEGAGKEDENTGSRVRGLGAYVFLGVGASIFSLL